MGESLLVRKGGGGLEINELVENYVVTSGGNVNAGTFIEFVNANLFGAEYQAQTTGTSSVFVFGKINDNTVAIITRQTAPSNLLSIRIATVSGDVITFGSPFSITTASNFSNQLHVLDSSRIAHTYINLDNGAAIIQVFTYSGTTITGVGTAVTVNASGSDMHNTVLAAPNTVICTWVSGGANGNARVATISGTTVTLGTSFNFQVGETYYQTLLRITDTTTLLFYRGGNSQIVTVKVLSRSGTTLSTPGNTLTGAAMFWGTGAIVSTNKAFLAYRHPSLTTGFGFVVDINGTSITMGSVIEITDNFQRPNCVALSTNVALIAFTKGFSDAQAISRLINISGTNMTLQPEVLLRTGSTYNNISVVALTESKLFFSIGPSTLNSSSFGLINSFGKTVRTATSGTVNGLAKTSGTAGQTIEVFVNG
jgi:hypothetical protein